jgi:hypothetical protein
LRVKKAVQMRCKLQKAAVKMAMARDQGRGPAARRSRIPPL